jgi:3-deoxy-D-manno-octulosonic-acid transferase
LKTKGIYFLYRALQAFGLPVLLLYFLYRGLWDRGYWRSLPERFGFLPRSLKQTGPGAVWLHAVSVGEVLGSVEFLRQIRAQLPRTPVFVSTGTLAGRATAEAKLAGLADGIFYAPVDYVFAVRRVLRLIRPAVVAIAETEIWPNLFREAKRGGAGLAVVNGRISERAFGRYRRLSGFFRVVMPAADAVLAQTDAIRERFLALGAAPERTSVAGNFKYDFEARAPEGGSVVVDLLRRAGPQRVWIAASTMPPAYSGDVDEDEAVLAAFREAAARFPGLVLILAPRKPAGFDEAARKLATAGIRYVRRSSLPAAEIPALPFVLLLDTIGELSGLFALADVVFMGGTLAERGGHNILEPAGFGKAVIVGPHMENFQAIADAFRAAGATVEIGGAAELADALVRLLGGPQAAEAIGKAALACATAERGASRRAAAAVGELFRNAQPRYRPAQPWYAVAWLLARVWKWGGRRKRERDLMAQRKVDAPVISVGNLTMGGTGKTPCVLWLARALKARGERPGILTRGYGRSSAERCLALAPGAEVSAEQCGDEPRIFVRAGVAPVGIGTDRVETGRMLRDQFLSTVLLLDDGFQHVRLAREVDIVLIDALNPFGGGEVFPLGRLREPVEGLARADVVVITRSQLAGTALMIERTVARWNPLAPVFRASMRPEAWVENRTGAEHPMDARPFVTAGAFCGLGNPQSFLRTLRRLGVDPADWIEFEDHHRYRPHELQRITHQFLTAGVEAVVTTEKDSMNLGDGADDLLAPLPLYWLRVSMAIEREQEFLEEIERRMRR